MILFQVLILNSENTNATLIDFFFWEREKCFLINKDTLISFTMSGLLFAAIGTEREIKHGPWLPRTPILILDHELSSGCY